MNSLYGRVTFVRQYNARNNARCMQARKTTPGLERQHQDVDSVEESIRMTEDRDKWRK